MADVLKRLAAAAPRWGLLLLALLFGAALMGGALRVRRDAVAVEQMMARAQAEALVQRLRRELGPRPDRQMKSVPLEELLEAYQSLGLRYLALVQRGQVQAEAGEPRLAGRIPPPGGMFAGDGRYRYRLSRRRPPMLPPPGFPGHRLRGGPERFDSPGRGPPGWGERRESPELLIEFEVLGAIELRRRSLVGLWVNGGATVALTLAALFLWRLTRRSQRMEAALNRGKHLATLGEMSAVLAHEIRNPLAALKGHAQLLAEEVPEGRSRGRATRVVDEAIRLERLTSDLLAFARSGSIERRPVSPGEVLQSAASDVAAERICLDLARAPHSFSLDGARVRQVLANLLENALDATAPDAGPVEAAVALEDGQLVFTVRDRGPGVPAEERERIFEAFVTHKTKGTGLGLAVARRIVELHGGRLTVDDAPGGGARFIASIPPGSPSVRD